MVGRTEQARWHGDRWYGGAVTLSLAGGATRKIHHEEARSYYITTSGAGNAIAALPIDVRNYPLGGPYFTIWNVAGGAVALRVNDADSTQIVSIAVGESAQIYLHDNANAKGAWTALKVTTGPRQIV